MTHSCYHAASMWHDCDCSIANAHYALEIHEPTIKSMPVTKAHSRVLRESTPPPA